MDSKRYFPNVWTMAHISPKGIWAVGQRRLGHGSNAFRRHLGLLLKTWFCIGVIKRFWWWWCWLQPNQTRYSGIQSCSCMGQTNSSPNWIWVGGWIKQEKLGVAIDLTSNASVAYIIWTSLNHDLYWWLLDLLACMVLIPNISSISLCIILSSIYGRIILFGEIMKQNKNS